MTVYFNNLIYQRNDVMYLLDDNDLKYQTISENAAPASCSDLCMSLPDKLMNCNFAFCMLCTFMNQP